jgi:hypothetical protein
MQVEINSQNMQGFLVVLTICAIILKGAFTAIGAWHKSKSKVIMKEDYQVAHTALQTELEAFKAACERRRAECMNYLLAIKEKQTELRQKLPLDYLLKNDFRQEMQGIKEWLTSIDNKIDKLISCRLYDREEETK